MLLNSVYANNIHLLNKLYLGQSSLKTELSSTEIKPFYIMETNHKTKCLNCNKETYSAFKKHPKYCNYICKNEYWTKQVKVNLDNINCTICGVSFKPKSIRSSYCSKICKYKKELNDRSKKPNFKICKFCGAEFKPYTSLDKFCSPKCRVEELKSKRSRRLSDEFCKKRSGMGNPAFIHGNSMLGKVPNNVGYKKYMKIRDSLKSEIISEYGFLFCQRCNINKPPFDTHHIIFRSEKPNHEHIHNKKNLIVLCVKCHNYYHKTKSNRNELVKERNLTELFGNSILRD